MVAPKDDIAPELDSDLLLKAYSVGLFPMGESADDPEIFWCDPPMRGVIPIHDFHISKKLRKTARAMPFDIRVNTAFEDVMRACAGGNEARPDTWINDTIIAAYVDLHERGYAHSVECWQEDELVGGLYGVQLGSAFFGESMFSYVTDASKIALIHLVARLWERDFDLLDAQFITDHLKQFGAYEMPQHEYKEKLFKAVTKANWLIADYSDFASSPEADSDFSSEEELLSSFLQFITQMS